MSGELHIELATARDVRPVAALHIASLPDSMISMLGAPAVERYYDLVTTSATEHVFVARAGGMNRQGAKNAKQKGEETGEVAAEHQPDPFTSSWRSRRLGGSSSGEAAARGSEGPSADRGPASTGTHAIAAACVLSLEPDTVLRRYVSAAPFRFAADLAHRTLTPTFRKRLLARLEEGRGAPDTGVPEVTQIFTDAAQRGRGLGSALLRACEDKLRALGHLTYCIHTLRDDNDAGIRFYHREGFTDSGSSGSSRSFGDHYLVMTKGLT